MKIQKDLNMFTNDGGVSKIIGTIVLNPCFHSVCLYRISSLFYNLNMSIFAKIVWYINRCLFNVDIDYRANLAGGFKIVHGLGIVIGRDVCSKGKLTVYQGVTLGGNAGKTKLDAKGNEFSQPVIGENVVIYTDAKLFGPVVLEDNTIVKAGSIIKEDAHKYENDRI